MKDSTLTQAICSLLGGIAGWKWGTAYAASDVGVFYGAIKAAPDRAVGVRVYQAEDDIETGLAQRRVQVRYRGGRNDPAGADNLADEGLTVLQGLSRVAGINGVSRESIAFLGADINGREERTDNYNVIIDNPEASQ